MFRSLWDHHQGVYTSNQVSNVLYKIICCSNCKIIISQGSKHVAVFNVFNIM
jgi:hypothetical protein